MEQHKNGYKQETSVDSADISKSVERFKVLKSFAGTLPADFDYEKNWRQCERKSMLVLIDSNRGQQDV